MCIPIFLILKLCMIYIKVFSIVYFKSLGNKPEVSVQFPVNLTYGKRVTVTCTAVDGDPPFIFSWFKDGSEIKETHGITIRRTSDEFASTLFISKLDATSNGNYTCRVKNAKGMDEKHGILLVKGKNFI